LKLDWRNTRAFIIRDWHSNPLRFSLEVVNWALNLVVAVIFAATVPQVPLLTVYPIFFVALAITIYSAVSRGSWGLLMTSVTMMAIDLVGYCRLLAV
jgi:hypothetical protein